MPDFIACNAAGAATLGVGSGAGDLGEAESGKEGVPWFTGGAQSRRHCVGRAVGISDEADTVVEIVSGEARTTGGAGEDGAVGVLDEETPAGEAYFHVTLRASIAGTCLHVVRRAEGVQNSAYSVGPDVVTVLAEVAGGSGESEAVGVETDQADAEIIVDCIVWRTGKTISRGGASGAGSVDEAEAVREGVV